MEGCFACDLAEGRLPLPGGLIHNGGGWLVEHCLGPLGVGTLILKPERHVTAVADLTEAEAASLGPLLRKASQVAGLLVGADQVYNCLWSHAGGVPGHIHYVIQPVTKVQMAECGVHGPSLQVLMFAGGRSPEPGEVELAAERARQLFGSV
jgi:diadenosine tetraphosphate (Ap4A) HIT family hydrolase